MKIKSQIKFKKRKNLLIRGVLKYIGDKEDKLKLQTWLEEETVLTENGETYNETVYRVRERVK